MMKSQDFDKWLELLRSGEYDQTSGKLKDRCDSSWCCLGLYAEKIGGIDLNKELKSEDSVIQSYEHLYQQDDNTTIAVSERYGHSVTLVSELSGVNTLPIGSGLEDIPHWVRQYVSTMNDEGSSFAAIADWLEKRRDKIVAA